MRSIMQDQQNAWNTLSTKGKVVTGGIMAAAVLAIFGATGDSQPAPEPEVKVKTVTETVEVPTVPNACLAAIGSAEEMSRINGEAMDAAGTALMGVGTGDVLAVEQAGQKITELQGTLEIVVQTFNQQKTECREAQ